MSSLVELLYPQTFGILIFLPYATRDLFVAATGAKETRKKNPKFLSQYLMRV